LTTGTTPTASKAETNQALGPPDQARLLIAVVGNPNTGKTALFNALTGFRRHVANYPGVTVDVGRGTVRGSRLRLELLDLPGTYSLAATAPDEMILYDALCGHLPGWDPPAAILAVVDASNLSRNLYLASQLLEFGRPLVVALNMIDVAAARGISVDAEKLSQRLGVPVVPVIATQPKSVRPLIAVLERVAGAAPPATFVPLPESWRAAAATLSVTARRPLSPAEALRVLIDANGYAERRYLDAGGYYETLQAARQQLEMPSTEAAATEVRCRYAWINDVLSGVIERQAPRCANWSECVDRVLTHRAGGLVVLALLLYGVFCAIYSGAAPLMSAVDGWFAWLAGVTTNLLPQGVLRSLVVDGLIAGVGGVVGFLPQIMILFMFIAVLEDCGYLARAAFMVDRLMRPLGLSGRAFIPLLSGFACAVPAILGARAIADRRERLLTILLTPFMSCSARLPIYVLLIGAFVPPRSWLGGWLRLDALVMLGLYLTGVVVAVPVAVLLRKTVLAGPPAAFLLELPSYKLPRLAAVWQRMWLAGRSFLVRAGTIILAVNLVVWALGYFPRDPAIYERVADQRRSADWDDETFQAQLAGAYLRDSYLGRLGRAIEPALQPLDWDWRIGIGVLASFPAREVIVATLGTVANLGGASPSDTNSLRQAIRQMRHDGTDRPLFTLPVALSLMVFFALCAQCASTLVMIGRETGSWWWAVASFIGMTSSAYAAAWAVSAGGRAVGL